MATPTDRIDRHDLMYEHAAAMPSSDRATRMVDLYLAYANSWLAGDFDGMLDRLVGDPVFELYPQRTLTTGHEIARIRAERLLPLVKQLDPSVAGETHETRAVAFGKDVMAHEFSNVLKFPDGTSRRCHLVTVTVFRGDSIYGERVYTDRYLAELVDQALGSDFSALRGVREVGDEGGRVTEASTASDHGSDFADVSGPACPALLKGATRLPSSDEARAMVATNLRYAQTYFDGDFERMFESLVEVPVFEQHPRAVRIEGRDAVRERSRRSYESTIRQLDPRKGADTHFFASGCVGDQVLLHEFSNTFSFPDGTEERCYLLAVVPFEGGRMVGERVYTDGRLASLRRETFGDDFEALPGVTLI